MPLPLVPIAVVGGSTLLAGFGFKLAGQGTDNAANAFVKTASVAVLSYAALKVIEAKL